MHAGDRSLLSGLLSSQPPESNGPVQTAFSQQRLDAWRPLFTPVIVTTLTIVGGALFLAAGTVLYLSSRSQLEIDIPYDRDCPSGVNPCNVTFRLPQAIVNRTTVFAYRPTKYQQNHQRYFTSRSYRQLSGLYVDYDEMKECGDFITENLHDPTNTSLWILPCGALLLHRHLSLGQRDRRSDV
jgi:hypothetical protein